MEDGTVQHNRTEVNKLLLGVLNETQSCDKDPQYTQKFPSPTLPKLGATKVEDIIKRLSYEKGLAFDSISDLIFNKENRKKASKVFRNLWTVKWEKVIDNDINFRTKLIPLNKWHPNIPTLEKFHPICVSSPIIKLMEVRLMPKL